MNVFERMEKVRDEIGVHAMNVHVILSMPDVESNGMVAFDKDSIFRIYKNIEEMIRDRVALVNAIESALSISELWTCASDTEEHSEECVALEHMKSDLENALAYVKDDGRIYHE